jgi:hypothetical protein
MLISKYNKYFLKNNTYSIKIKSYIFINFINSMISKYNSKAIYSFFTLKINFYL